MESDETWKVKCDVLKDMRERLQKGDHHRHPKVRIARRYG